MYNKISNEWHSTTLQLNKKSSIYNIRPTNIKSENRSREIKIVVVPNLDSNINPHVVYLLPFYFVLYFT